MANAFYVAHYGGTEVVKAVLLQVICRFHNIKKIDSKTLCFESLSSVKLIAFWSLCGE